MSAGRHGSQGYLQLGGNYMKGKAGEGLMTLDVAGPVYLGGLPDMSEISEMAEASARFSALVNHFLVVNIFNILL